MNTPFDSLMAEFPPPYGCPEQCIILFDRVFSRLLEKVYLSI